MTSHPLIQANSVPGETARRLRLHVWHNTHFYSLLHNQIRIRPPVRKKKPRRRLDVKACRNPDKVAALREQLYAKFQAEDDADPSLPRDGQTLTAEWEALSNVLTEAAVPGNIKTGLMKTILTSTTC